MKELLKGGGWMVVMVVLLSTTLSAVAESVILISFEDATISEHGQDLAPDGSTTIDSGSDGPEQDALRNRGLLKFDLASNIPSNAIVTSAALTLTLVKAPRPDSLWFSLHKILRDWDESAVTWTNRLSPPASWSIPGCAPPLDYSSFVTQSNLILGASVPAAFTFVSNDSMVADVQDWVSNPMNNFGWILVCELEDLERSKRKFASKEHTSSSIPTNQPLLEVQFTLPPAPLALTLLPHTNGLFQFQFNAESNRNYTAEFCSDLVSTNWIVFRNITLLPAPSNVLVFDGLQLESNRFYRVRAR